MDLVFLLLSAYTGMVLHFINKAIKASGVKTVANLIAFYKVESLYTLYSFITITMAVILLYFGAESEATITATFMLGFAVDGVVNKWEIYNNE